MSSAGMWGPWCQGAVCGAFAATICCGTVFIFLDAQRQSGVHTLTKEYAALLCNHSVPARSTQPGAPRDAPRLRPELAGPQVKRNQPQQQQQQRERAAPHAPQASWHRPLYGRPPPPSQQRGHVSCFPPRRAESGAPPPPAWWAQQLGVIPEGGADALRKVADSRLAFFVGAKATTNPERFAVQTRTLESLAAVGAPNMQVLLGVPSEGDVSCEVNDTASCPAEAMRQLVKRLWGPSGRVHARADKGNVGERIFAGVTAALEIAMAKHRIAVLFEDDIEAHPALVPGALLLADNAQQAFPQGWMLTFWVPWRWHDLRRAWPSAGPGLVRMQNFWGGMAWAASPPAQADIHSYIASGFCGLTDMLMKAIAWQCYQSKAWCADCNATCHGEEHCMGNSGPPPRGGPPLLAPVVSLVEHTGGVSARTDEKYEDTPKSGTYAAHVDDHAVVCMLTGKCSRCNV
eukprot:TRINITY_DN7278_c0_g1_i1.p1 TRINITY_DN7278_c0_g1~~TRINITY_DN7278_c0_g1_i1.p1  ORF type:complete len:459 (+),score=86.08 TRINITY_DN7278_c0_g1_i1:117-1493(+)